MSKRANSLVYLPGLTLLGATLALPQQAQPATTPTASQVLVESQDRRAGFGKLETITGRISMVIPEERLVVVTIWPNPAPNSVKVLPDERLVVVSGSEETPLDFKVTGSTWITVGSQRATLTDLAAQTNQQASVRFIPLRNGNFAQTIEVSP